MASGRRFFLCVYDVAILQQPLVPAQPWCPPTYTDSWSAACPATYRLIRITQGKMCLQFHLASSGDVPIYDVAIMQQPLVPGQPPACGLLQSIAELASASACRRKRPALTAWVHAYTGVWLRNPTHNHPMQRQAGSQLVRMHGSGCYEAA